MDIPGDDEIDGQFEKAMGHVDQQYSHDETKTQEMMKAQLLIEKRLVYENSELRDSIDKYRTSSKWHSRAMIFLSFSLLALTVFQIYNIV